MPFENTIVGKGWGWLRDDVIKPAAQTMGLMEQPVVQTPIDYAAAQQSAAVPGFAGLQQRNQGLGNELFNQSLAAQGRAGPQWNLFASDQARAQQNQVRGQQQQLSNMLMAQARGEGPSLAQMQLAQATDRNLAQAMAMGASQASGSRGAGALRNIQNQRAQIGQQMSADSGMLRMQEMLQARQLAGQQQAQMRGMDQQMFGAENQLSQAQVQAQLAQRGLNDSHTQSAWANLNNSLGREGQLAQQQAALNVMSTRDHMDNQRGYDTANQLERDAVKMNWQDLVRDSYEGLRNSMLGIPGGGKK